jgi:PAS domain S-box-containing protein
MQTALPHTGILPSLAPPEGLDVERVLQFIGAVSGSMELGTLRETIVRTAMEHSRASRAALLGAHGSELRVQAEGEVGGGGIVVRGSDRGSAPWPEARDDQLQSLADRAARTGQPVMENRTSEPRGRSILCLPLETLGSLVGVLCLENDEPFDAFTSSRVAELRVLASCAAMALEKSRAFAELAHRQRRLQRLVDADIVGVATCDAAGRIIEANDAYLSMLGYTRDDLVSDSIGWRGITPPEWADVSMKAVAEIAATGRCEVFEKEYFRKDGSRVPILLASAAIDDSMEQIVAFVLDLTSRKQAEEALKRSEAYLAEAQRLTHTGSWAASSGADRGTHWSEETFRIYENCGETLPLDQDGLLRLMHPADREGYCTTVADALRSRSDFVVEFRVVFPNGTLKHLHIIAHPRLDDYGDIAEWVGTIVDITERKHAEEERNRLAGEIHDTLAQALAMIVMQLADAEAKLGAAWSRAEKPLSTVRELAVESLGYARRSMNVLRPRPGAGGLARSVRDVVESLRRHFSGSLNLAVTGNAVLSDATVESALVGIAREALTNAIKHSMATRIGVELNFAKSGSAQVVISDDGIGFDPNAVRSEHYGLLSMQERASRARIALTFVTEPSAGTTIVASWSPESAAQALPAEPDGNP